VVGRAGAIADLAFKLRSGQNVLMAGPRRTGKSSIAAKVMEELEEAGLMTVRLDFLKLTTLDSFAGAYFEECVSKRTPAAGLWSRLKVEKNKARAEANLIFRLGPLLEAGLKLSSSTTPEEMLTLAMGLPALVAREQKRDLVVVFDEFQDSTKLHREFLRVARPYVTATDDRVSYLFLGSQSTLLHQVFNRQSEPLFRSALAVDLPGIADEEWVEYLRAKFEEVAISVDRRLLGQLVRRAGGHPQDTMTVAFCLYQLLFQEQRETARETDVVRAIDDALGLMAAAFEQLWLEFNSERGNRIVIARLARGVPLYAGVTNSERAAIDRSMKRLLADGYIQKLGRGSYRLTEPLLAEYVSRYLDVRV
jgi:AAA+ ATPase superfamily predicted ATPase